MKNLENNVSFIPDINAALRTVPIGSFYSPGLEKTIGTVFLSMKTGRPFVQVNEDATEEEAQDMIKWMKIDLEEDDS